MWEKWSKGPDFLWEEEVNWPSHVDANKVPMALDDDPEVKKSRLVNVTVAVDKTPTPSLIDDLAKRVSSWNKLKGIVGWIFK